MRSLLITRPEHDCTTRYFSKWSEKIIEQGESKGTNVIDLHLDKANRDRVIGTLEKREPGFVFFNGHGGDDRVAGHNDEVILNADDGEAVKNKIIYARSCKSAKILGHKTISYGARAYIGYKEDFTFLYSPDMISRPLEDESAALFLEPTNHIAYSLLKNHTASEAHDKSRELFRKNIEKLLAEGPSAENYSAIRYLYWDMINQVCLGNGAATFV